MVDAGWNSTHHHCLRGELGPLGNGYNWAARHLVCILSLSQDVYTFTPINWGWSNRIRLILG